jgi:hypothetical protein
MRMDDLVVMTGEPTRIGAMSGTSPQGTPLSSSPWPAVLTGAGLVYVALGLLLGAAYFLVGIDSSLFPTGWLLPAVLLLSGSLMTLRRRFDIAITLWAGLALATFMLGVMLYVDALDLGLDDPAAFDASIIVAGLGLLVLVLRPAFRD